jgi:hypothetical protein
MVLVLLDVIVRYPGPVSNRSNSAVVKIEESGNRGTAAMRSEKEQLTVESFSVSKRTNARKRVRSASTYRSPSPIHTSSGTHTALSVISSASKPPIIISAPKPATINLKSEPAVIDLTCEPTVHSLASARHRKHDPNGCARCQVRLVRCSLERPS